MTCFCTQTICTTFSVILLLFSTNIVKNCSKQKNRTLNMKTCQKWKSTQDNYNFHPNLLHIIFRMKIIPRWLRFVPKSFAHNFRSFCCCFTSIQLKNIMLTSLGHLARKLPKVTNQHMRTCFCIQTLRTSFAVILMLFPTNMIKKCSEEKNRTLNTKTCQN